MTGEVKKLPDAIAVLRKRERHREDTMWLNELDTYRYGDGAVTEELEIVEIVKYKIPFASQPEPVGD
jgi:chromosome transmission fidelity protein 8